MVKATTATTREWIHEHSAPICTVVLLLGWLLLGSFSYDLIVRDTVSWVTLLFGAPMVLGGWTYIVRQD